ncbi:MFS transporter [Streptomyces sp. NPDC048172]|uniref:MFS transporter n=1 Tax=Streptomyces sp. NPDC048172 TaxID=3365505 RepID=UPI0037201CF6
MRTYLVTAFLARLADEGMAVAVTLLALDRTDSAAAGAFVLTAWMAPHAVAAPLAGALAARARRPPLFHGLALALFAAAIAGLALTVGRTAAPVPLLLALVGGCCGPVVTGGLSSLVAGLAPEGAVRNRAYALDAATYTTASVVGPAAVGLTATLASPGAATGLMAASAACAAPLATTLGAGTERVGPQGEAADGSGGRGVLRAGVAALWRVAPLRAVTGATTVAHLGLGGLAVSAVLLADHRGDADGGGVLMTAFAVGALGGALALARWEPPLAPSRLAALSLLATGLALAGAALVPSFAGAVALFALAGVGDGPLLTTTLRIRADHAPPGARTPVFTLGAGLKVTAASAGAALTGVCAGLDPSLLLLGIAALQLAAAGLLPLLERPGRRGRPGRGPYGTATRRGRRRAPSPSP